MKHVGLRFGASGALVFLLDLGLVALLGMWLPPLTAVSLAYVLAVSTHFWLNRTWVFSAGHGELLPQAGRYILAVACCWFATVFLVWAGLRWWTSQLILAKVIAIPPVTLLGFVLMQGFVFKARPGQR